MFSKSLVRAANRTCVGSSTSSTSTVHRTTKCLAAHRQPHQRRPSSSKTSSSSSSCPPEDAAGEGKPAPAAKVVGDEDAASTEQSTSQPKGTKKATRSKRTRAVGVPEKQEDQFAGLPAVPGMHMQRQEFSVSNFFSLHRPLSLATTIPPTSNADTFGSIFEAQKSRDPWENGNSAEGRPEDAVYALRSLFEGMNINSVQSEEDEIRWEYVQEGQDGVKYVDGTPSLKTLNEMIAQFRPFEAPPPPQPFPEAMKSMEKQQQQQARASKPKQKRYATTIILTESTSESGQKTYTASTTPIVRISEEQATMDESLGGQEESGSDGSSKYAFRDRMQRNQRAYQQRQQEKAAAAPRPTTRMMRSAPSSARLNRMLLISVKRLRKLKMKKHKYKKLMKRTRNLRRRQDRN